MNNPEFLTALGLAFSIFLTSAGSSFSSYHSGVFALRSDWGLKCMVPIIISGVLAIYGLIISVILCGKLQNGNALSETDGYRNLASGLSVGLACLSSGFGIGYFIKAQAAAMLDNSNINSGNQAGSLVREGQTEPLLQTQQDIASSKVPLVRSVLVLIYLEAIGLYGLIVALILAQ